MTKILTAPKKFDCEDYDRNLGKDWDFTPLKYEEKDLKTILDLSQLFGIQR